MARAVATPMLHEWLEMLRREFRGYGAASLQRDVLAGLTVAAVALPLALAFGVAAGADAAAGVVTAIIAGVLISALGGSPYQISGPTGAMSAVLIAVALRHGLAGIQMAGLLAGLMILVIGALRLGRLVSLIPAPVITGFTSGIAVVIAAGQLEALLGVTLPPAETSLQRLATLRHGVSPDPRAVGVAAIVMAIMLAWPRARRWRSLPGSLVGIVVATAVAEIAAWPVSRIGEVPGTLLLPERLRIDAMPWDRVPDLLVPAFSIAALGSIETLLCGAVAGNMTRVRMHNNLELLAQGIGNTLLPFFGGVPATAAIARTSVGIRSGGATRLTGVVHGIALLLVVLVAAPVIGRVPLAALAGVLMVTAWRMNEWGAIRLFFGRRLRHAIATFAVTLAATVALDLTQAIFIGVGLSAAIFLAQVSDLELQRRPVEPDRLGASRGPTPEASVYYLSGPLFFAASRGLLERIERLDPPSATLILSIRGVPLIDATGLEVLRELIERQRHGGGNVLLCSVQPRVESMLRRSGLWEEVGENAIFWSADRAILALGGRLPDAPATGTSGDPQLGVEGRLAVPHEERLQKGS